MEVDGASGEDPCAKVSSTPVEKSVPKPSSLLGALLKDQSYSRCAQRSFRESYLNQRLSCCESMYSCDIRGHHGCVNALAFSKGQEQFLASGGDDQRVLVWRVADVLSKPKEPKPFCMNTRHTSNIFTLDFSCDNAYVFSGGEDKELLMHDFKTLHTVNTYEHMDAVYCVATHPNSPDVVYTASEDGCVYIIDTRVARRLLGQDMLLCEAMDSFQCVAINPVEPVLIAVSNTRSGSALYDVRNKKKVLSYNSSRTMPFRNDGVSVSFSGTGSQVYSMYRRRPPTLHNLFDPDPICYFSDGDGGYKNTVTMKSGCFMGQDDEYVVSGSDDFRVYVWKVPSAEEVAKAKEDAAKQAADVKKRNSFVSSNCVTGYKQTSPHLILPGHRSIVNQTRFSTINRILVTSGVEKVIKVWSEMPIHSGHTLQRSRDPPARRRFTPSEIRGILTGLSYSEPSEPAEEDMKVLALFDNLMDEDDEYLGYSDDSLSPPSDLIFPFFGRRSYFLSSDSDSLQSDYYHPLERSDFDSYSGSLDSDDDDADDDGDDDDGDDDDDHHFDDYEDDWDSVEEEEEEGLEEAASREDARDEERHRSIEDVLNQILRNADENLLGLQPDTDDSSSESDSTDTMEEDGSGRLLDDSTGDDMCGMVADDSDLDEEETVGCLSDVKLRKCTRNAAVHDLAQVRGKNVAKKRRAQTKALKTEGIGTSSGNGAGASVSQSRETSSGMVLRSRNPKATCNGSKKRASTSCKNEEAANGGTGACALEGTCQPSDHSVTALPGASGEFTSTPGSLDNSEEESANGSCRIRSKRKKLLEFRAKCDSGGLREHYTAEDFLRVKSPVNFYNSNDKSRGKGGSKGGKKKGRGRGGDSGASGSSR